MSDSVLSAVCLREPVLSFAAGREHVYTKKGISRYGPASLGTSDHPSSIKLGYVGSGLSIASARAWFDRIAEGVRGDGTY